jgi:hypothetical protein
MEAGGHPYEIVEADQIVQIHMVGRSLNPR